MKNFPSGSDSQESACKAGEPRFTPWVWFNPWVRKIPREGNG